jgi:hypothetical protein
LQISFGFSAPYTSTLGISSTPNWKVCSTVFVGCDETKAAADAAMKSSEAILALPVGTLREDQCKQLQQDRDALETSVKRANIFNTGLGGYGNRVEEIARRLTLEPNFPAPETRSTVHPTAR